MSKPGPAYRHDEYKYTSYVVHQLLRTREEEMHPDAPMETNVIYDVCDYCRANKGQRILN